MANNSSIEWTEATWNPIVGCSILSPGCIHCYAMDEAARQIRCAKGLNRFTHYADTVEYHKGKPVWTGKLAMAPDSILLAPLKRKKPTTYFVNSMGDLFHEDCPDEWIDRVFAVMALAPQHTFQVLTKRAGRLRKFFERLQSCRPREDLVACEMARLQGKPDLDRPSFNFPLPNVWLGVSTERQQEANERIPLLLQTPAAVRFISAEPLLGPIDLHPTWLNCKFCRGRGYVLPTFGANHFVACEECIKWARAGGTTILPGQQATPGPRLDWVIAGGESGPNARPMHPDWVRSLRDQCKAADVAFFFKQWGEYLPWTQFGESGIEDGEPTRFRTMQWDGERWSDEGFPSWIDSEDGSIDDYQCVGRVGKKAAGRLLDGVLHDAMPERRSI